MVSAGRVWAVLRPADLEAALDRYAALYAYIARSSTDDIHPVYFGGVHGWDRGFRKGTKQQSSSWLNLTVNWHIGYNEEALEREDR